MIDATATHPIAHRDAPPGRPLAEILADPRTLQVEDIIDRTEYALGGPVRHGPHRRGADRIVSTVVFLLVPRLHLLDLAGPAQAFSTAAELGHDYRLHYVGRAGGGTDRAGHVRCRPRSAGRRCPATTSSSCPAGGAPTATATEVPRPTDAGPAAGAPRGRRHRGQRLRRARTRSAGPGCSTGGAAPPTTTCRTSWPAGTRGPPWSATCCTSSTGGWSPRPASPAASTWPCT